ncbi:hypothetical protein GPECTOR_11g86 [Gonium pectorale]|uniref:Rieske domain-containing protein n=1 Tax=Gonium pectorale TaxID=33097 RepID=A0A150GQ99_GONPE|nr:hypothetical protein GPECTOR_11g86 [Gonium pectorale]|eukprot:KXZ51963.1 hypothetical protein GPECTOR_11g86 [Gonium pectorale]
MIVEQMAARTAVSNRGSSLSCPAEDRDPCASSPASPSAAGGPQAAASPQRPGETFPWFEHWYPVAVLADLDPRKPHAAHLLGIPLALWRDKSGTWHAVEDKCPHRLAPLSEGRVESDGTLQCAYHGWQFDGRGACTHIPQLRGDDKAQQVACASRRACVRAFPVQEVHGLLWVLPDSSEEAWSKAAAKPVPSNAIRELLDGPEAEGMKQTTPWFTREFPIRFDTLLENIADPSHVNFAHHNVQGKRGNEKGTTTRLVDELRPDGFSFEFDSKSKFFPPNRPAFNAPCFVRYSSPMRSLNVYAVPTRPGWSRLFSSSTADTRKPNKLPWFVNLILGFYDNVHWAEHAFQRNAVLDGDTYMLHIQERLLRAQGDDWQRGYYMPAPADSSVVAMRRWLDEFGGAVPTCEPGAPLPPAMSKREVLDRYSQHTKDCRHCQAALRNIDLATALAAAGAALAAVWLVARAVVGLPLLAPASGWGALAAVACAGAVAALRSLRQQFFYVDYVHAERH